MKHIINEKKIEDFIPKNNKEKIDDNILNLYKQYKQIFDKIKDKISNDEEKANAFIKKFIDFFNITNDKTKDELTILFKSKKFEKDINSIIFFFKYFETDNKDWNSKLSSEYENISQNDFKTIETKLESLKKNEIYDYKNVGDFNKLFTSLYNKKEAIDFLLLQNKDTINILKDKIDPTDRSISIKDLIDTKECISQINKMKNLKFNDKIFTYIKSLKKAKINQFVNYSKIYLSVIEIERNEFEDENDKDTKKKKNEFEDENDKDTKKKKNEEDSRNLYMQVNDIIKIEALFIIFQDNEEFKYLKEKDGPYENISLKKLKDLKNRIQIKDENKKEDDKKKDDSQIVDENKKNEDSKIEDGDNKEEDNSNIIYEEEIILKRKKLIFFKKSISNLEIIINYMKDLRAKGSSLPITITIKINDENIEYYLGEQLKKFKEIREFLSNAKNN
jgi:hypothetical protein